MLSSHGVNNPKLLVSTGNINITPLILVRDVLYLICVIGCIILLYIRILRLNDDHLFACLFLVPLPYNAKTTITWHEASRGSPGWPALSSLWPPPRGTLEAPESVVNTPYSRLRGAERPPTIGTSPKDANRPVRQCLSSRSDGLMSASRTKRHPRSLPTYNHGQG